MPGQMAALATLSESAIAKGSALPGSCLGFRSRHAVGLANGIDAKLRAAQPRVRRRGTTGATAPQCGA